jgi:hypothetical protein
MGDNPSCAQIAGARLYHKDRHFEAANKYARIDTMDLSIAARGS